MAKRNRSPNYPAVSLKAAVGYLSQVRTFANGQHFVPMMDVITGPWKMKAGSAYGKQVVAALKSFGLIEDKGSGDTRQIRVTDRGVKIDLGSDDRGELLQEAALFPTMHRELWERYGNDTMPPKATLRQYLLFDRDGASFTDTAVEAFIEEFRETLDFAEVEPGGTMGETNGDDDKKGKANLGEEMPPPPPPNPKEFEVPEGSSQFALDLPGEGRILLQTPAHLSADGLQFVKLWIDRCWKTVAKQEYAKKSSQDDEEPEHQSS